MIFTICENTGFYLRMGLVGPSGSGKTYSALSLATELGYERIAVIDTENKSARRYARSFSRRFYTLELSHFSPRDYIEAMHAAREAGFDVLVIDSLSHAWMGRGGVLEMVDQSVRRQARGGSGSSFNGWREVTPEHNRLVEALVHLPMHLIVTMRVKTEYVVEKDPHGKSVPRKVGLAPVQREGLEYEFDIVGDLSPEHELAITKSRCPEVADLVVSRPGAELAQTLRTWVDGAAAAAAPAAAAPAAAAAAAPAAAAAAPAAAAAAAPAAAAPSYPQHQISPEEEQILPWLKRIDEAKTETEERLDAVRNEMNSALKRRTRAQGEALRRAIEVARAAIRARVRAAIAQAAAEDQAQAAAEAERRIDRSLGQMGDLPGDS